MEVKSLMSKSPSLAPGQRKGSMQPVPSTESFKIGFHTPTMRQGREHQGSQFLSSQMRNVSTKQLNDLSMLLSPTGNMDRTLEKDLSQATLIYQKQKLTKESWIDKLKKGNNYKASPDKIK